MKAIRILSIIGIFLGVIGFCAGTVYYFPSSEVSTVASWCFLNSLYLTALCIGCLVVIKVKTQAARLKELEEEVKKLKEMKSSKTDGTEP